MELLESGCLKIVLSNEDLEEMGLTFDRLDYRNAETQRAIQRLLLLARQETGFHHNGDLTVEAIPLEDGCLLLLTPAYARRRVRMKKAVGPYIYRVPDIDGLFRLAENWNRLQAQRGDAPERTLTARQLAVSARRRVWAGAVSRHAADQGSQRPAAGVRSAGRPKGMPPPRSRQSMDSPWPSATLFPACGRRWKATAIIKEAYRACICLTRAGASDDVNRALPTTATVAPAFAACCAVAALIPPST